MPRTFVTFGMNHHHLIGRHVINGDTVAVLDCESAQAGRERAFELFGPKFSMEYHEGEWNETQIKFFPKGYVYVDRP